jgi:hypothetical protein
MVPTAREKRVWLTELHTSPEVLLSLCQSRVQNWFIRYVCEANLSTQVMTC